MRAIPIVTLCVMALTGCGPKGSTPAGDSIMAASTDTSGTAGASTGSTMDAGTGGAMASLKDAAGRELGMLMVSEVAGSLTLSGTLRGLTPGEHGIHIHTTGSCDAPAFTSAGGHWNPTNTMHGSQNAQGPHLGDLMNLTVGSDSTATVQLTTKGGSLRGASMLMDPDGAAIVVHAKADDYKSDPSGDSGDRVACGVVTAG